MEKSCKFNQEQKLVILESVKEVGIKEASLIADDCFIPMLREFWWSLVYPPFTFSFNSFPTLKNGNLFGPT